MNSSLISQIVLVVVGVVLIIMYILPGFDEVRALQDEQAQLQNAIATADEFDRALAQLESQVSSIPQADLAALDTYLPEEVDQITTMWVLETVAEEAGVSIDGISVLGTGSDAEGSASNQGFSTIAGEAVTAGEKIEGVTFEVDVTGSYSAFKTFLSMLEGNEFPLLPQKLKIGAAVSSEEEGSDRGEGAEAGSYTLELLVPAYQSDMPDAGNNEDDFIVDDMLI